MPIDKNLEEKGSREDNAYRFIERVTKSTQASKSGSLMTNDKAFSELKEMCTELRHCTEHVTSLCLEVNELKQLLEASRKQLQSARCALCDVTNGKLKQKKGRDRTEGKAAKLQCLYSSLEADFVQLINENTDLSMAISAAESELISGNSTDTSTSSGDKDFSIQTKHGKRYSPAIRKLY